MKNLQKCRISMYASHGNVNKRRGYDVTIPSHAATKHSGIHQRHGQRNRDSPSEETFVNCANKFSAKSNNNTGLGIGYGEKK